VALARKAHAKSLKQELLAKNKFDALINTTPCGMAGIKQALPIKENELNAGLVFDMVYNPLSTPLLKLATAAASPSSAASRCSSSKAPASSKSGPASPPPKPRCSASSN
jgi:hypothetical protein